MDDLTYWTEKLREGQAELEAARTRTAVNTAASKVMRAKEALKRLKAEHAEPKRRANRGSRSAVAP